VSCPLVLSFSVYLGLCSVFSAPFFFKLCFSGLIFRFSGFFPPSLLLYTAFYKALRTCPSNQSWLCRTVIPPWTGLWAENVVTIGSVLLPIFQLPCWIGMKKTHDCSLTTVSFQQEWKYSLWPLISLISTIGTLISNNWFLIVPFRLILIKSLNWYTIYKTVLNSWIVQFGP